MSPYKIIFHPEAKKEFDNLDGSVKKTVLKQIEKLQESPTIGERLGNKAGMDLTGYWKVYANKKQVRIVYSIQDDKLLVFLLAIGKREEMGVYHIAAQRKKKAGKSEN